MASQKVRIGEGLPPRGFLGADGGQSTIADAQFEAQRGRLFSIAYRILGYANGSLVDALLADHGLFHLEADLRWIDLTTARLDALAEAVRT